MKLQGLSWVEIQDIKNGIEKLKVEKWNILTSRIKKSATFEQIVKLKEGFDKEGNPFISEGRYNHILNIIQDLDDDLQKELEVKK